MRRMDLMWVVAWLLAAGLAVACGSGDDGDDNPDGAAQKDQAEDKDTGGGNGAVCTVPGPGQYCLAAGCPSAYGGGDAKFASADGTDTAEITKANSGGNNLDWTVTVTDGAEGGGAAGKVMITALVPEGTTDLTVTKISSDMAAGMKEKEPFIATVMKGLSLDPPATAELKLKISADCGSLEATYKLTWADGSTSEGTLTLPRPDCPPCE